MTEKKKLLFVINPTAGRNNPEYLLREIRKFTEKSIFSFDIALSQAPGHATEIVKNSANDFDIIVAVGGDGTVNEVLNGLDETKNILGIVPCGSGNGFANSLKLSKNPEKALKCINELTSINIDVLKINEKKCINVAGVGFDGYVAKLFKESKRRGLSTYAKIVLTEFNKYEPQAYSLIIDDEKRLMCQALLVSFANSTQFGNNAHIAPFAKINDGLIDICILKKIPNIAALQTLIQLFTKKINLSKHYQSIQCKNIKITSEQGLCTHIDGEFIKMGKSLNISIQPVSLRVLCNGIK
jgi:diacylglycerol kinase (ATP)